jgi:hypothetical protein
MTMANNKKEHSMNHQKQSQSNPIYIVLICVHSWLNSKQTQIYPPLLPVILCGGPFGGQTQFLNGSYLPIFL